MEIRVTLSEMIAKKYSEGKRDFEIEIKKEVTIEDILEQIGVPTGVKSFLMYTVNGKFLYDDKNFKEGDHVKIFPLVGGG